jgi:hypothetical protein
VKLKTGWKKCPSVTAGGKKWFYYHDGARLWVVWDRRIGKWMVKDADGPVQIPGSGNTFDALFPALHAAQKYIEHKRKDNHE